jgi:excisionase family DNA binding protein
MFPGPMTDIGMIAGTIPANDGESPMSNHIAPLALTISEACSASRSGRTTLYGAIKRGELRARKRGRSTIVLVADLRAWLESLPERNLNPKP